MKKEIGAYLLNAFKMAAKKVGQYASGCGHFVSCIVNPRDCEPATTEEIQGQLKELEIQDPTMAKLLGETYGCGDHPEQLPKKKLTTFMFRAQCAINAAKAANSEISQKLAL